MKRATFEKIDRIVKLVVTGIPLPLILIGAYFVRSFWIELVTIFASFLPYFIYNKIGQSWLIKKVED